MDIDSGDNPAIIDWRDFVKQLGNLREVAFAGLSVSGNGSFCLISICDTKQYEAHFRAIEEDFLRYGINIDHAYKDASRLRIYSHNEHPIH